MTAKTATNPYLVVLGAGDRDYKAHQLQQLASVHRILLLDPEPEAWTWPYIAGRWAIDLTQEELVAGALTALAQDDGIAGVTTYLEDHIPLAARIAEDLGLPSPNSAAMRACRDKLLTRSLLDEHHIPSARSVLVEDEQDAVDCAEGLGYPVVIKPRALAGGAGVMRADTGDQVRRAVEMASGASVPGLDAYALPGTLVEEYLDGPEISVECVVLAPDDIQIVAITRKHLGPQPRFLAVGHCVDAADELLDDPEVRDVTTRAIQAVGVGLGVVHVELRLTSRGPCIVEVNGGMGGDLIPLLVQMATGVSLPRAAAELALGREPDLTSTRTAAAAVQFAYADTPGLISRHLIKGRPVEWLERVVWTRPIGDMVEAPALSIDDRLGHWVVTGPHADACHERLGVMDALVTADVTPLTPGRPVPATSTACVR